MASQTTTAPALRPTEPPQGGTTPRPALLELVDISKRYGGVHALRGAELRLDEPGRVHGLIGENGSGKSTLLSILSGQIAPDMGTIRIDGRPVVFHGTLSALANGIAMVSQETAIAPDLSVAENILLGRRLVRRAAGISWRRTRARAAAILDRLELEYDLDTKVRTLRPDQRQMVEIARALSLESRILILDEPTSSLSDDEVKTLFATVRTLKQAGVTTIFVSHRMAELFEICDEITVLRDGQTVGSGLTCAFSRGSLVDLMVGERRAAPGASASQVLPQAPRTGQRVALQVRGLGVEGLVHDVSFDLQAGEIVGIAGLVGAGRSELLEAIYGVRRRSAGTVCVDGGQERRIGPAASIRQGVGFLPPDRKEQGLVLSMNVRDNSLMVATHARGRLRRPRPGDLVSRLDEAAAALNLRYGSASQPVSSLSGGNQQKVAITKWLLAAPRVLLLDEPTRGVDVGSKQDIHLMLKSMVQGGMALLVSSSENDELLEFCDRIIVMSRGRIVQTVQAADVDEAQLTSLAGGNS